MARAKAVGLCSLLGGERGGEQGGGGKKRGELGGGAASCSSSGAAAPASLSGDDAVDEEEKEALASEVHRLRQEQAAIGDELARMSRRLQATERRPNLLMSFLASLAEDPDGITRHLIERAGEKKRRRLHLDAARPAPVVSPILALGGADFAAGRAGAVLRSGAELRRGAAGAGLRSWVAVLRGAESTPVASSPGSSPSGRATPWSSCCPLVVLPTAPPHRPRRRARRHRGDAAARELGERRRGGVRAGQAAASGRR